MIKTYEAAKKKLHGEKVSLVAKNNPKMMKYSVFCAQYWVYLCALEMKAEKKSLRHAAQVKKTTKLFYLILADTPGNNSEWSTSGINTIIPAQFPLLFLVTKQAMRTTRVSNATAHMIPMNQLLDEILSCAPTASANTLINQHQFTGREMGFFLSALKTWRQT